MEDELRVWLARDKDGCLFLYHSEPARMKTFFLALDYKYFPVNVERDYHPEITWENSPVEINLTRILYDKGPNF